MSGKKSVIRYETQSGIELHITPVSLATLRAIMLKAEEIFPYPPKKDYEKPLENTFVEGMVDSAENNPDYIQACMAVDRERSQWRDKAVFMYAVHFADFPDINAVVQTFAPQLLELRKIAIVPDDNFDAIFRARCSGKSGRKNLTPSVTSSGVSATV